MRQQAYFVLNNPAYIKKSYDFNPANLHSLYSARNNELTHPANIKSELHFL